MITEKDFNDKQRELCQVMSDISEDCYCAGWMAGLEFAIWGALQDGEPQYGFGKMAETRVERCRALAAELNGWIVWVDDDVQPGLPSREWGPRFISMAEWLIKLNKAA